MSKLVFNEMHAVQYGLMDLSGIMRATGLIEAFGDIILVKAFNVLEHNIIFPLYLCILM